MIDDAVQAILIGEQLAQQAVALGQQIVAALQQGQHPPPEAWAAYRAAVEAQHQHTARLLGR